MKRSIRMFAAALAAVTAMSCTSVGAFAVKYKTVDGIRYVYTDDGKLKGKFTGWVTAKSGAKYYFKDGVRQKNMWLRENGVRTYLLDKNGKVITGEYVLGSKTYLFGDDGKLIYGVQVKASDKTANGMKLALNGIALGENKSIEVWSSRSYYLEYKDSEGNWRVYEPEDVSDDWREDEPSDDERFFIDGSLVRRTETINWTNAYGKLPNGDYRLCKPYFVRLSADSAAETKMYYFPFTIKRFKDAESAWGISMTLSDITTEGLTVNVSQPTTCTGYIEYYGSYILERQDENGNWKDVDKKTRTEKSGELFSDLCVVFGDDDDPNGQAGGSASDWIDYYSGELDPGHYRVRRLFSGYCNKIKGSLYATAEFDIISSTPNGWGLSLSRGWNVSESGITLVVNKSENFDSAVVGELWTGEAYTLERLVDGNWEDLEAVTDEIYWDDIGLLIPDGGERRFVIDWTGVYGKLPVGTYRLGKTFYRTVNPQFNFTQQKTMFLEFAIGEGGVNIGEYELDINVTRADKGYLEFEVTRSGKYTGDISWDGSYDLYKKNSKGKWKLYNGKSAINSGGDMDEVFTSNGTITQGMYISDYPNLTSGSYRLKLKVRDQCGNIRYFYGTFEYNA